MSTTSNDLIQSAIDAMEKASDDDNTLDRTLYYSSAAIMNTVMAAVVHLRKIEEHLADIRSRLDK